MRDIRNDLLERLAHAQKQLTEAERNVVKYKTVCENLRNLLAAEDQGWAGVDQQPLSLNGNSPSTETDSPLANILRSHLADGKKHHLDELVKAAKQRNYPFGDKAPGRVIHFALIGMKSGGSVDQIGDGYWKIGAG
jgi:hypothetical protein